jgi:hypothetical protein
MNTLIRLRPNSIVLGLMGRVNYAWAQLDLISTAAFASLLNLDPVELGMAIGRIETQAKIEKMREISRHRGADELSAFFANIKSQLKRLRPDRNAVTHGAYMGKTHKGELCFRLPAAFIVAEGGAGVIVEMRTPDQYREFAAKCYRLAAEAKTEVHQKMMDEMARAWSEVAEQAEKREGSR